MIVVCVIDYTEKNDQFISRAAPLKMILIDYYINFFLHIAIMLAPLLVFISTVFVTAKMASLTEIVAILSAGVSFKRFLLPYFAGALIISGLIFYLKGYVIPRANKIRMNFENIYVWPEYHFEQRNIHIKVGAESYVYMESYNNSIHCGYQVTLETLGDSVLKNKITANRLIWLPESKKWRIEFWKKQTFEGKKEYFTKGDALDTTLSLHPEDFESQRFMYDQLTLTELDYEIKKLTQRGAEGIEPYQIEKYDRFTYPFSILLLTIIGVIISSKKSRKGMALQITLGFMLAFTYIFFVVIGRSLASVGGIPAVISCWIPNFIFTVIGFIIYWRIPK